MRESFIIASYLITPKGTLLHSKYTHDYQALEEDGQFYMIDGGNDYIKYSKPDIDGADLFTLHSDDEHDIIREFMKWGKNYDKEGNRLLMTEWILLKDLTDDHIIGIITYLHTSSRLQHYLHIFEKEKLFRKKLELICH